MPNLESIFQSGLTFFGLTPDSAPQYRVNIFTQIHEIVFWGQGGYNWESVYNMPIWLRNFTFNLIRKHYEEKNKQHSQSKNSSKTTLVDSSGNVNKEAFKDNAPPIKVPKYK